MHLFRRAPKTILLCALCLLLTACTAGPEAPEARVRALRRTFADTDSLSARAVLTADYGERVYTYTVAIDGSAQAGTMTVEEPENIAGTVLQWSDGSSTLSCEDITLETGPLTDCLSPADAVNALLRSCQTGQLLECGWEEQDSLLFARFTHPEQDAVTVSCWFDAQREAPRRCELSEGGRTVLTMDFSDFSLSHVENSP